MAEQKDMCSSFARAPKLQSDVEQSLTRRLWNPPKRILHIHGERRSHNEMVGGEQLWKNQIQYLPGGQLTNWGTIIPKKFLLCCEGSRPHIRLLSLEIWPRDWEFPGNLTLKASEIWFQSYHRTGRNRDSWRATKGLMNQDPEERSNEPTGDWARPTCVCLRVSWRGVGGQ